jgi:sterol desaturase/sphingolipid hydroxylase (fatty acid hydroxylase superfamily)
MDLIALAVPVFLLMLLIEIAADRVRGTKYYRANDAINSLSAGTLSTSFGYFTRLIPVAIYGFFLQNLAIIPMDSAWFDLSPQGLLLWLLALLSWDFCYYWKHRFGHEISVLWAAHAVHHQSEDYNLSTALRQTSSDFLFGWIFFVPLFVIGFPLEIIVTVNAIDLIYQFWVHTQHVDRLGWYDRVFVSPSNHRVHHAQNERYIDKNYGGILILWDRLFGTYQEERDDDPVVFGVRKPLANWNPFWANFQVYGYLWFDAVRTRRWRDKLGVWFRRTGWRPEDVAARYPKRNLPLENFRKFDPDIRPPVKRYLVVQFTLITAWGLWIASLFATEGLLTIIWPSAFLWISLYSFGLLSEGRQYARAVEMGRLLLAAPAVFAWAWFTGWAPKSGAVLLCMGGYSLLSAAWWWQINRKLL